MDNANQIDPFEGAELIFSYTRKQAIEDGVLVDLMHPETAPLVREAGFTIPLAMTVGAFAACIKSPDSETPLPPGQDVMGRLWDVLTCLRYAGAGCEEDRVFFKVAVQNGEGKSDEIDLWALVGPGDDPAPVMTIMLEGED